MAEGTLCTATYDEPQRQDGGHRGHVCDLTTDHNGPHYCSTCETYWVGRTGVITAESPQTPQRKQIALARMDAHLLGAGFVMVTRSESGKYTYLRLDPEQISLHAPKEGWDTETAESVAQAAFEIMRRRNAMKQLRMLVSEAEARGDRHRHWVHTALLKKLLDNPDDTIADGLDGDVDGDVGEGGASVMRPSDSGPG